MQLQRNLSKALIATCIAICALTSPLGARAQSNGMNNFSIVTLQTIPGQQGQSVITPKGMVVPLPGPGVNGNSVEIYMGHQGGYWYTDKNGQNVDLTGAVQHMQSMNGAQAQTAPVPQYAPQPQYIQQQSSGSSAAGTAAVAGMGAMAGSMAGAAIAGTYNNTPYGTPYYPHNGSYAGYGSGANGNTVNVNKSYTAPESSTYNNVHANNMQQQQEWYNQQQKNNPQQYKQYQQSAAQNPFVNPNSQWKPNGEGAGQYGQQGSNAQQAAKADGAANGANQGRRGRFGRNKDAGESAAAGGADAQNRLGDRDGAAAEGGRFAGRGGRGRFGR